MDILRFITAGNVDDGKSTLIGRLLHDTNNIKVDVLLSVSGIGSSEINLAHITDGLRAERAKGITIDVAYKYFTTKNRKYVITDAPGHFQYTKNLVTGASGVDAIIILIDARNGITEQTKRHSLVASFLNINEVVIAVNKLDLMGYDEEVFLAIKDSYTSIAEKLQLSHVTFIPISALKGDNVSSVSKKMDWFKGQTLMQYLEACEPAKSVSNVTRFSIQYIIDTNQRGYLGKMLSGTLNVGDAVVLYPSTNETIIKKILCGFDEVSKACAGQNICLFLEGECQHGRGNTVSYSIDAPKFNRQIDATICWLNTEKRLQTDKDYFLRMNSAETICRITKIVYKINVASFEKVYDSNIVEVNEFARVIIETDEIIAYDPYTTLPENGRGIIIDKETNYTSGAFIIEN